VVVATGSSEPLVPVRSPLEPSLVASLVAVVGSLPGCSGEGPGPPPLVSLPAPLVGCFVRQRDEQGQTLPSVPVTWKTRGNVSSPDPVWRRIVIRVRDLPDDATVTWKIAAAHATGSAEVAIRGDQAPKDHFSRYFGVAADQKTTALKVGVA